MDLKGSWSYIQDISRSRLEHNKTSHHVYGYGNGLEVMGAAGEIVARRYLGLSEELHVGFDGGCDIRYAGLRIDVKATVLTPNISFRALQWPQWKPVKAEIILLVGIDSIRMIGVPLGYATREEVEKSKVCTDRVTPCHEIQVIDLHNPYDLVARQVRLYENSKQR